ncbi:acyl carrier protein [Leptolyngbya ohadii]|uniref:acyl carrier protein n=1 Tax=Leptolyngbya ohadii TaxID=1962290 RepID=UPI000B59F0E6|nr:acyl carrier protein [Leptolyngbya ohadii]
MPVEKPVAEILRQHIAETILFSTSYPYEDTDSFMENGVLDSMNVMELVVFLEQRFGIQVADHEIIPEHFDSIRQMSDFVQSKQQIAA